MPKAKRSSSEVEEVKIRILQCALELISEKGYDNFSMRKIAKRIKMTAANIYNYFSNKDNLYIELIKHGFNLLYEDLKKAMDAKDEGFNKIKALIESYIEFGIQNPQYFDLMFNRAVPKYLDNIGAEYEEVARIEMESSKKTLDLAKQIIIDFLTIRPDLNEERGEFLFVEVWSQIHGLVSLFNSGIFSENFQNPKEIVDKMINRIYVSLEKKD